MKTKINRWLNRYAKTFYDEDFGYRDCDMIDSCCHDLDITETADRKLVGQLVDDYIATH